MTGKKKEKMRNENASVKREDTGDITNAMKAIIERREARDNDREEGEAADDNLDIDGDFKACKITPRALRLRSIREIGC